MAMSSQKNLLPAVQQGMFKTALCSVLPNGFFPLSLPLSFFPLENPLHQLDLVYQEHHFR